jgi:hypothetical protein
MRLDLVDELVVKEMISNYNHVNQCVKLKGRQINIEEGVARIFGLSRKRITNWKGKLQPDYCNLFHWR